MRRCSRSKFLVLKLRRCKFFVLKLRRCKFFVLKLKMSDLPALFKVEYSSTNITDEYTHLAAHTPSYVLHEPVGETH